MFVNNDTVKSPVFWVHFVALGSISFGIAALIPYVPTFRCVGIVPSIFCISIPLTIIITYPTKKREVIVKEKVHPWAHLTYDEFCSFESTRMSDYKIDQGRTIDLDVTKTPWHQWSLSIEEYCKFHISINAEHMEKAFGIIFPKLLKMKVTAFKIMGKSGLKSINKSDRNQRGKEYVIYLSYQDVEKDKIELFLKDLLGPIVQELLKAKVIPGEPSLGDLPVKGGQGFLFFRTQPTEDVYISADELPVLGFTIREGSLLSCQKKLPPFENITSSNNEKIRSHYPRNIQQPLPNIIKMDWEHRENDFIKFIKRPSPIYSFLFPGYPLSWKHPKPLTYYFERAAKLVEKGCIKLNSTKDWKDHRFSPIMPALYYHFIVPLRELEAAQQIDFSQTSLARPFEKFPELEERLLIEIIKCSFREFMNVEERAALVDPVYIPEIAAIADLDEWVKTLL